MTSWYMPPEIGDFESAARNSLEAFLSEWDRFVNLHESSNTQFIKVRIDRATQKPVSFFNRHRWVRSGNFPKDVKEYFEKIKPR